VGRAPDPPRGARAAVAAPGATRASAIAALVALAVALALDGSRVPGLISNDAYGYADVALNLAEGRGLTQSALGYNAPRFPATGDWPAPFTGQGPLFPVAAAGAIRLGADPLRAPAIVSAVGLALAAASAAGLAGGLFGPAAAPLAGLAVALPALSPHLAGRAWSESVALALLLLGLRLVAAAAVPAGPRARSIGWAFAAGVAAGACGATRYALLPAVPFVAAAVALLAPRGGRARAALAAALGGCAVVAPVVLHNLAVTARPFGAAPNPSTTTLAGAIGQALARLSHVEIVVPAAVLLALGLVAAARGRRLALLARALTRGPAILLPAWIVVYIAVVMWLRSRVHFDDIGLRLLAPAIVPAAVMAAGAVSAAPPRTAGWIHGLAVAGLFGIAGITGARALARPEPVVGRVAYEPPVATWLRDHAPEPATVVAEDAPDLVMLLRTPGRGGRRIASFAPLPYMQALTASDLATFARRHGGDSSLVLVVRRRDQPIAAWRASHGEYLAALVAGAAGGNRAPPPGARLEAVLPDAWVFRVSARR
jgi:hypothetical protein